MSRRNNIIVVPKSYTIIMQDDFNDNNIDLNKWSVTGPILGTQIIEQNQRLEIHLSHIINSGEWDQITMLSKSSITSGVAVSQCNFDWNNPGADNAQVSTGVYFDVNNFAVFNSLNTADATGNNYRLLIRNGGSFIYIFNTSVAKGKDVKVTYDFTNNEINFWYWGGASWVQVGTTQTFNLGAAAVGALIGLDRPFYQNIEEAYYDNFFLVDGNYNTATP